MEKGFFSIEIKTQKGDMSNYSYLIIDKKTKKGAVIDPSWEIEKILNEINKYNVNLEKILITHCHNDHVNLVDELVEKYNANVYISKEEHDFYDYKSKNLIAINDKDIITLGDTEIKCILTPGHTKGGMCFLIEDEIFTGDTLFIEACGRCDLPGGNAEELFESIKFIKENIDQNTIIHPGHPYGVGENVTLSELNKRNPYYKISNKEEFIKFRMRKR